MLPLRFRFSGRPAAGGLLALLLLAGAPLAAPAQKAGPTTAQRAPAVLPPGPPPAAVRRFSAAELQRLRADDDLQYRQPPPPDNPILRWFYQLLRRIFGTVFGPGSSIYWKIFFYGLALGALVLVVLQLLGLKPGEWLRGRGRRVPVPYAVEADDVHEETLPDRLRAAEEAGQWRLATRLGYLLVLKALTDRTLIDWQPQKTNHHYDAELRRNGPALAPAFGKLTWEFEYVWYGEFALSREQYAQVQAERRAFLTDLTTRNHAA
ncbi:DUF4129 domain-containing protein [Hymenobacter sp. 15J16-1T3B]|uniref:DUF4129 domain-containing protein n=1 Tax=Hymenobacter sp. 15J16-1T3B TaxID=2886941 RepID=UPI001D101726|nr:DUF4129 domain-containing protein [Hymenobacter sp. 15J16-1T3B]MCC3157377.1 DUF4129 domain-containing protein [Hymenobacter sp. 15J16-1T3B]